MKIELFYLKMGARLRDARDDIGHTQEAVAAFLSPSLTRASIANIENGRQRVMAHHIVQFSQMYQVSVQWLMEGTP